MNDYKRVSEAIEAADFVLIGLGEEMQFDWSLIEKDERYNQLLEQAGDDTRYDVLIAYLQRYLIGKYADKDADLYDFIYNKIKDKNYFVISQAIDDLIYMSPLDHKRIVTPCGGFRKMQCPDCCTTRLWEPDERMEKWSADLYRTGELPKTIECSVCPDCGKELVFNQIGNGKYCEEGYLEQWEQYKKWLQGTMNRKVCMIELGVGMQFPSVIRWPFEKMALYNQKAKLFRIHSVLFQVGEEIRERAWGIQADVKEFIRKWEIDDGR